MIETTCWLETINTKVNFFIKEHTAIHQKLMKKRKERKKIKLDRDFI